MSESITTVAAMRRALTPGRKLSVRWEEVVTYTDGRTLRYPCARPAATRTVKAVRSADVQFTTESGSVSTLSTPGVKVMPHAGGFEVHCEDFEGSLPPFEALVSLVEARQRGDMSRRPVPANELVRAMSHTVVVYIFVTEGAKP